MKKICRRTYRCVRSPLSLLISSVVNPNYFNFVSYFYSEKPFNILVALLASFLKYLYFYKYGLHVCMQYSNELLSRRSGAAHMTKMPRYVSCRMSQPSYCVLVLCLLLVKNTGNGW